MKEIDLLEKIFFEILWKKNFLQLIEEEQDIFDESSNKVELFDVVVVVAINWLGLFIGDFLLFFGGVIHKGGGCIWVDDAVVIAGETDEEEIVVLMLN